MGELTQATEVYSVAPQHRTQQLWRALLSWLTFFFQIFFQILRTLGHYPLLSFSSSNNHNNTSFKPLPYVELHDRDEQDNRLLPPRLISLLPPPITPLPIDSKNSRCIVNLVKWWKQIQLQR